MRPRPSVSSSTHGETSNGRAPKRTPLLWFSLFILFISGCWAVYHFQFERLPVPLSASQAGKRGFSEELAMDHVKALTKLGPHSVGSDALDIALQYVLAMSENIKKTAHWEVDVDVDFFHAKSGCTRLSGGMFKGKTVIYSGLKHVVLRILPKYLPEAGENVILISSHVDTVFTTEGAGDCTSCVSVMLELGRVISQWAHGFRSGVIFLFNTGEEEGLSGAHSFITQHPWRHTVRFFVDLEAMGIGGKSAIFQSGTDPSAIEAFAKVAKYPSGQIISQDLFMSGAIKSSTDFQVYTEVAGLSGLDFAYTDSSAVYHTKNDKLSLLKPGSLQHLGENMLAFLLHTSRSPKFLTSNGSIKDQAVFFDILGVHMVSYRQTFARTLQNSFILQALLIWITSLLMGGYRAIVALALSAFSIALMWVGSLILSIMVAFILSDICSHPAPYIANYWLVFGLFGAPAVIGALTGQHFGFRILQKYFGESSKNTHSVDEVNLPMLEAERWLFKAGCLQWLILLIVGNFLKVGSSYIALVWLVSPAFSYGLIEATLTPSRLPKQLRAMTLLLGLSAPIVASGGVFIRLLKYLIEASVRFDRNPGSTPSWLGNLIVAGYIAALVCLTLVYLFSYIHLSGAKKPLLLLMGVFFGVTLISALFGFVPAFTADTARVVNVVHIVDSKGGYKENISPASFISLFSVTPGKITKELENLGDEEFSCSSDEKLDLVSFAVNYGCRSLKDSGYGWDKMEIPTLHVESDVKTAIRKTQVLIDTKISTRWSLAINSELVEDFIIEGVADTEDDSLSVGSNIKGDGWHIIQFAGGKQSPRKFFLTLFWSNSTLNSGDSTKKLDPQILLKLRTDVDRITPKTARVLAKLPSWCSLFGKSSSPLTLAFLANLRVDDI